MNCFDWQNRASDYLDGALPGARKLEADEHLEHCHACMDHFHHYRTLVETIASQPRSALPIPIRKAPLTAPLPKRSLLRRTSFRWSQMPWHLRTPIEGLGIIFLVLIAISAGPRIRNLYE